MAKAIAKIVATRRGGKETLEKRPQIETRSPGDDGQVTTRSDLGEGFAGEPAVIASGAGLVRLSDVHHMVWNPSAVFRRRFGGADVHTTVHGH